MKRLLLDVQNATNSPPPPPPATILRQEYTRIWQPKRIARAQYHPVCTFLLVARGVAHAFAPGSRCPSRATTAIGVFTVTPAERAALDDTQDLQ